MQNYDVVIIGGGPAGYTAAIRVTQLGGKAVIIEKDMIGGVCLNHGCIPTVSLARAVELLEMGRNAKDFGIAYKEMEIDFKRMMSKKETVVRTLVSGVKQMLEAYGVSVIEGTGKLLSPSRIEVSLKDGTRREIAARKIIISTGTRYPRASFPEGLEKVLRPAEVLKLKEAPRSMAIVGGGFIGSAMATIFSRLGAKVSMLEESSRLLPAIDKEVVAILEKEFRDNNIEIYSNSRLESIAAGKKDDLRILINRKGEEVSIEAQYVLISEGREANIDGLGLKEADVHLNEKGGGCG